MTTTDQSSKNFPNHFDIWAARKIIDSAKLVLAPMLPGCTARRYDFPTEPFDYSPIELCFGDHKAVVPTLSLGSNPPNCSRAFVSLQYKSLLRDPRELGAFFLGHKFQVSCRLDAGPAAIATELHGAIVKTDIAEMIAAGSIERLLAEHPSLPVAWPNFQLAQCAVYLGRYDEATALLQDALHCVPIDRRPNDAGLEREIQTGLAALASDPGALRQSLVETVNSNWSHFKSLSGPMR